MKKAILILAASMALMALPSQAKVKEATPEQIVRVEPPCWWTGMKTSLQLMVQGPGISGFDVAVQGNDRVRIVGVHKADNPDFIFIDVDIARDAEAGTVNLVFTRGKEKFSYPYGLGTKSSLQRESFNTSDVIYLIVPDRFANGDPSNDSTDDTEEDASRETPMGRHGGDIQGIIDHLDYISDLGATAIWSTPLLLDNARRGSYHGYACADYYRIDPRFGDNALYREMVKKAHEKGIKVIMDIVTNHCGTEHWWMKDMPFKDWVHMNDPYIGSNHMYSLALDPNASASDRKIMEEGWFSRGMPDMNLDNPYLLKYFQQWAIWWIEYSGLDGFRVDTYFYNEKVPMSFWCKAVTDEYPWFNIVGENWNANPDMVAYWQSGNPNPDGFDSHLPSIMDFPLRDAVNSALAPAPEEGRGPARQGDISVVYNTLARDFQYHDLGKMLLFWSNHDTPRLGDIVGNDYGKMKIAFAMLATMRGIPQMFYGDEMMFSIGTTRRDDGRLRMDFPGGWSGDEINLFTEEGRKESASDSTFAGAADLHDYVRTLLSWRKDKEVIHSGKTMHFIPQDNTYAYFRYNDTDLVFVYVNNSRKDAAVTWSRFSEITGGLGEGRNVITGETVKVSDETVVPASSVLVVEYKRQTAE